MASVRSSIGSALALIQASCSDLHQCQLQLLEQKHKAKEMVRA
jgi:hypothetical protein